MDKLYIHKGDVLKGQWTLAELSSPVACGAIFIRNFTVKQIGTDPRDRVQFHLIAEDLFYSSIEGWTVPVWDFKKVKTTKKEYTEAYKDLISKRIHAYTMISWDMYANSMKKSILKIASRNEFKLNKNNLMAFMSKSGMKHSAYLEDMKIENLLNLPESAFKGGNARGLQRQIQKRWGTTS